MLNEEMDNGFANRFLWVCSQRSKSLPEGGRMSQVNFSDLQARITSAVRVALEVGAVERDDDAAALWGKDGIPDPGAYHALARERHGLFGTATARAPAQVLRLSLVYALLDRSEKIRRQHLEAALEVWRYCEDSAKYIFGDALGDPTADEILRALRASPGGMTRTEIAGLFARNKSAAEITRALMVLHKRGLARFAKEPSTGRSPERWFASAQIYRK